MLKIFVYRRKRLVRPVPPRILAVRKVQAPLGIRIPHQGQAVQEPARVWRPLDLASVCVKGLQGLLLRALQPAQPGEIRFVD